MGQSLDHRYRKLRGAGMTSLLFLFVFLFCIHCGAIENALDILDECTDFSNDETNASLNEDCRALDDFLPENQDNLASQTMVLGARESVNATNLFLLLTDSSGTPIDDLEAADFTASASSDGGTTFESIIAPEVATLEVVAEDDDELPQLSFASVIDYSGSILDEDLDFVTDALTFLYQDIGAQYRSEVVKFSTDVQVTQTYTDVEEDLLTAVQDETYPRELTSLFDGMIQGIEDTSNETTTSLRMVILFTDGMDNDSENDYEDAKTLFQENDIPVCVVGVSFADVDLLTDIAEDSGCFFIYRTVFDDLEGAFETITDLINNTYRVRFGTSTLEGYNTLKLEIATPDGDREVTTAL